MPLVKDTSYHEMPFSSETPCNVDHGFHTIPKVVAKVTKHQNHQYMCRSIGVVTSDYGFLAMHEIDDSAAMIPLSFMYSLTPMPFLIKPFTAEVFGCVQWIPDAGPVMFVHTMAALPPPMAVRLRDTMKWISDVHRVRMRQEKADNDGGMLPPDPQVPGA